MKTVRGWGVHVQDLRHYLAMQKYGIQVFNRFMQRESGDVVREVFVS